jgi:hypothetical protein
MTHPQDQGAEQQALYLQPLPLLSFHLENLLSHLDWKYPQVIQAQNWEKSETRILFLIDSGNL